MTRDESVDTQRQQWAWALWKMLERSDATLDDIAKATGKRKARIEAVFLDPLKAKIHELADICYACGCWVHFDMKEASR